MQNSIDNEQLQRYVNENDALHDALGVQRGVELPLKPLAQGEYNVNYTFDVSEGQGAARSAMLRVNLGSQMHLDDQIGYEMDALRLLAPSARTPKPLYVDGSCRAFPHGVGVEELLPGRPLRYETDLDEAAHIFADIHALVVPDDCHLVRPSHPVAAIVEECDQLFSVYRAWPQADASVRESLEALFEVAHGIAARDRQFGAPERAHIVNTEVNSSNFLINDGPGACSYLVDWEKPVAGEVAQDLGHFLVPTTTYWKTDTIFDRSQVDGFLDLYIGAVDGRFDTTGLRERLEDYLVVTCLRGLSWCAMALTEYEGGARAAANADTYAKIKEYLQPEFLAFIAREYYGL